MGYYDNALAHSSGPWKKHKYTQKIGEGANAVYRYAKKAIGAGYKREAEKQKEQSEWESGIAGYYKREADIQKEWGPNEFIENPAEKASAYAKSAEYHGRKSAEAQNIYNKSLLGMTEKTVAKGRKAIDNLFKSETTITITSNLMPAGTKKIIKKK